VDHRSVFIALRQSPDWKSLTYADFEKQTVEFCRLIMRPTDFTWRVVKLWDDTFSASFFATRQRMKEIAQANLAAIVDVRIVHSARLAEIKVQAQDIVCFVDDDDWFHPNLGSPLRQMDLEDVDAVFWDHCFFGREEGAGLMVQPASSSLVYTNNYAVTGSCLSKLGIEAVEQHWIATESLKNTRFQHIPGNWGMTNKHPASTVMLEKVLADDFSGRALAAAVDSFIQRTEDALADVPPAFSWAERSMQEAIAFYRQLRTTAKLDAR